MLVVVTSSADPELALIKSHAGAAIVVPAHLSQPGWSYEVGSGARAQLVTSKGIIAADDVSGVLTRTQRAWPAELPHINEEDREYVASEMTAFLAALLNELPCPVFNRPAANSLWGPPWTAEHWWRVAVVEGIAVCRDDDHLCDDPAEIVVLEGKVIRGGSTLPDGAKAWALRLAERAGVLLLGARFCLIHGALREVSLRPGLDEELLRMMELRCAAVQAIP
ncbi:MAG: hypothetical protein ACR2JE_05780 [Acidobacteriaceae bacterium]